MRHAVIMAGGAGTRLWPLSRQKSPKQFHAFTGEKTLLIQTFDRLTTVVPTENIWVITTEEFIAETRQQLPSLRPEHVISEPLGRNTGPAIALSLLAVTDEDAEATIGVFPADHYIGKESAFTQTVEKLFAFIEKNPQYVGTIGINPTEPHTGYGYIEMGKELENSEEKIFAVNSFHEKPDQETAHHFFDQWQYLWNGGIFLFQSRQLISHFQQFGEEVWKKVSEYYQNPSREAYGAIPSAQFDKLIVEKLDDLAVIPADMDWSDIGDWAMLHKILAEEGSGRKSVAKGEHLGVHSSNNLVLGQDRLIATVGVSNLIVVDAGDAILVCNRDSVQEMKALIEKLKTEKKEHFL